MSDFAEKKNSRQLKRGANPSFSIVYIVVDEESEYAATELVRNGIDPTATIEGAEYPITDISAEPLADHIWEVPVTYGASGQNLSDPEEVSVTFDTTGNRVKVTNSLSTTTFSGGTAPDFQGAVGVTKTSVEGAEVTAPGLTLSLELPLPAEMVTDAYVNMLADLTGNYNNAPFRGRAAGEVRFDGATGTKRSNGATVPVSFKFTVSPNVSGMTIGAITGINKLGWQYLWILYEEQEDGTANALVQRPIAVYVEDLPNCQPVDFALLGIGT